LVLLVPLGAVGLGAGLVVATSYKIEWRLGVIRLKLRGQYREVGWVAVLQAMGPKGASSAAGFAKPVLTGEEPCPVLWETPVGSFWGRAADRATVGGLSVEQSLGIYERGPVTVRTGDVVLDVGSHLGLFTRHRAPGW
jgi:hypothetical protein